MGATGWSYFVPYQSDISLALQELRKKVFAQGKYENSSGVFPAKKDFEQALIAVGSDLKSTMDWFAAQAANPDLPKRMRDNFATLLKQYASSTETDRAQPRKPATIEELLELEGENGTHSILDVVRISKLPTFGGVTPLQSNQLLSVFGTEKPTRAQVEAKYNDGTLEKFASERWQGVYIICYNEGSPKEIFFVGCSGD